HTLMVEASDKAGNKTTQKLDFIIDTLLSEPTITLDSADDSAAVVNQFNTVNGDVRVHCHRQRRGLLHISGPIFYLHRQDIVAV
ncbi:hypothetical protein KU620_24140, partial [Salmonella enterica subsp. enterica serovar Mbandaka]|nr:hypothetical protein [Salmonella enterica subsp. enterica serovar Mbandaka]